MSPNAGPPRDNSTRGNETRPSRPDNRTGAPASAGQGARPSRDNAANGNGNPPNATSDHTDVPRNPVSKYPGSVTLTPPRGKIDLCFCM